ncbi:MAG: D-aminoacylase [Candidatus Moduliflexus flocculans]|nr:D-aminoacylase [Candidatus Moduliflexus flocculans]
MIEADGLAVSPGFIDVHDHTDTGLLVNPRAESAVRQGVTTLVSGQCGGSPFPLTDEMAAEMRESREKKYGLAAGWKDITGFLAAIEKSGTALNYTTFVGNGTVRAAVMGRGPSGRRAPELDRMRALVAEAMAGGALGLSSGLEYTPSSFASTEELIELGRVAARTGGVYATHMRDEETFVLEAVAEALRIAREAPIRLQISHLKVGFAVNWPKLGTLMDMLEKARAEGLDFRCDRYPYIASATGLGTLFPIWSREGGSEGFLARLSGPGVRRPDPRPPRRAGEGLRLVGQDPHLGRGLRQEPRPRGEERPRGRGRGGESPYEFMRDLLIEESDRVGMVSFYGHEDNLERILSHPLVGIGADSEAVAPYGPLSQGKPHPRTYGTFPRALGKYVRDEKIVPLEEMIRKMTGMPAAQMGFVRRGLLKVGWAADVCVFDPATVADRATFKEPAVYPEGIRHVVVNGQAVVDAGEHTGRLPGRVLRKNAHGAVA